MNTRNHQRGSTLLVGLVMLVVLTLLVISAIRASNTDLRIAGNMQMQQEATTAAQDAIENVLNSNNFTITPPPPQGVDINGDAVADYTVTFNPAPVCTSVIPVVKTDPNLPPECLGTAGTTYCYWTTWDLAAVVTDPRTGASTTVHQGVRTLAGLNAAVAQCGI